MADSRVLEYRCRANLNLYNDFNCDRLATQAAKSRQLRLISEPQAQAIQVRLCEDDYPAWLSLADFEQLEPADTPYQATPLSRSEIEPRLEQVIAFTQAAMQSPNEYLWGGTVAPNYDCSGLMQAAFAAVGIWLPRDSYQQEAFTQAIPLSELQPGDLIFFGSPEKTSHVALSLGEGKYIHSSGKDQGRNGIGIDWLSEQGDSISQTYYRQLRGAGRVMMSYLPQGRKN